jgi:hypothetical protein
MYSQVKVILAIGVIKHHFVKVYGEVECCSIQSDPQY